MATFEGSSAFIELLNAAAVDYIYYNPGLDVVPLLSAAARYQAEGKKAPRLIMCLDEFTALNAAHGSYMVSGKPQVVLVHAELGTQQLGGAIQQAWYGKVPVVICAADTVAPSRLNWRGEPYDQAAMLRNCLKWDHKVGPKENIYETLRRALQIAGSEPCGPVYLTYPLDVLSKKLELPVINTAAKQPFPVMNDLMLDQAAELLVRAENPLIMTAYSGRHPATVTKLVELAEILGARVVTTPIRMNFPSSHPLCANMEPNNGQQPSAYSLSSDVILLIDYDMPYAHPRIPPKPETKIIHIDSDFIKQGELVWNRQADIAIQADSSEVIPLLITLISQKLNDVQKVGVERRSQKIEKEHQKIRREWATAGQESGKNDTISAEWLAYCINRVIDEETIIVNQTISPAASVTRQIPRNQPGTLLACSGGTIGWALGAALGAKIAAPDKLVVGLMGDGAFVYGGPTATLWPAEHYKAPFLSVIFNNQAYGAIKNLFRGDCHEGVENACISPSPDYAMTARACGAWGKMVNKPQEVLPALQEALADVKNGRAAVLDVRLGS